MSEVVESEGQGLISSQCMSAVVMQSEEGGRVVKTVRMEGVEEALVWEVVLFIW